MVISISKNNIALYNDDYLQNLINKLKIKMKEINIENKIDQIESEYLDKLKKLEIFCNNEDEHKLITNKNSLEIIQKELDIIKLLSKYTLQNKNLDYNFFIKSLNTLLNLSEILRSRLGQKEFNIIKKTSDIINRCSYKFCSYQHNCNYNYNNTYKNICYQDHYVHNMVSSDLKIIINFINNKYQNNNNIILKSEEILKTINTLNSIDINKCHFIKNK